MATAMKPHKTIKQLKDKRSPKETAEEVFSIPCKDCDCEYVAETRRRFGVKDNEHMKDMDQLEGKKFIRSRKKEAVTDVHKSALMDDAEQGNHSIDWGGVRLPAKEPYKKKRGIFEDIEIQKAWARAVNWDKRHHRGGGGSS